MAEAHRRADVKQAGFDRRRGVHAREPEPSRGSPHEHRVARRLRRGNVQEPAGRRLQLGEAAPETFLDLARHRQLIGKSEPARELG